MMVGVAFCWLVGREAGSAQLGVGIVSSGDGARSSNRDGSPTMELLFLMMAEALAECRAVGWSCADKEGCKPVGGWGRRGVAIPSLIALDFPLKKLTDRNET